MSAATVSAAGSLAETTTDAAFAGEAPRERRADAPAGSGDDDGFA